MGVHLPGEDIYVIGLSNCDCHSPTTVVRAVAEMTATQLHTEEMLLP